MRVSSKTIIKVLAVLAAVVWAWNMNRNPVLFDQKVKGARIEAVCLENPLRYGVLSGLMLGFPHGLCVTNVSESEGVPSMVLDHVRKYSASIYRAGQILGFALLTSTLWGMGFMAGKVCRRILFAMLVSLVMLSQGACSSLPERSRHEAHAYGQKMAGYSATRFYGEPVGYYAANLTTYSDVAEIAPSQGFVYGSLNVRRPLLYDDSIEVYQRDALPRDSYWRQGTVILASAVEPQPVRKTKPASNVKKTQPEAQKAAADKPLSERVKPVAEDKKSSGKAPKEASSNTSAVVREQVLAYMVLDGRDEQANVAALLEMLKQHSGGNGKILRLVGHDSDENLMGKLKEAVQKSGFSGDVEMFNTRGTLSVGGTEVPKGIEAMVVQRTFVERKS